MRRLIHKIVLKLINYCEKKGKVFVITGTSHTNGDKVPYMVRYMPFKSKYGSVYIHRFLRPDHDVPHDHPFSFLTYVVKGKYMEEIYPKIGIEKIENEFQNSNLFKEPYRVRRDEGSVAFRLGSHVHKVLINKHLTMEQLDEATLTLCFIGPVYRKWGFWELNKPIFTGIYHIGTWTLWTKFLGIESDVNKRG